MSRLSEPQLHRWPHLREDVVCALCGNTKPPTLAMCVPCFQREHMGKGQYSYDTIRRLNRADQALADADPWADAFDGLDDLERSLGVRL